LEYLATLDILEPAAPHRISRETPQMVKPPPHDVLSRTHPSPTRVQANSHHAAAWGNLPTYYFGV
jgi:hypothetical protein